MRVLLLAVCFPAIVLAQDAGSSDGGAASDVSRALNQAMGMVQANQRTLARQQETIVADGQRWRAARDAEKGAAADKKYRAQRSTEQSLTQKHGLLVKKYGELVARLEKLARDHADKKVDPKKAAATLDAITREESRLMVEQGAAFSDHALLVGASSPDAGSADAGAADPGLLDAGAADAGPGVDAGSLDAGAAPDSGTPAVEVAGPGVTKPPRAKSCTAAGGGPAWMATGALWWVRGLLSRRRRG